MAGRDYNPARYKTRTSNDELQSDEVRKIVQLNARISFLERQLGFRDAEIERLTAELKEVRGE